MTKQNYMTGKHNKKVIDGLKTALSDTFILYFKTHAFHWNVEGSNFHTLHVLFEEQYNELWASTDILAERIRALDEYAPLSMKEIQAHASLKEAGQNPDAEGMIKILEQDNMAIVNTLHKGVNAAEESDDVGTADILTARIEAHEKAAWMLRSLQK